MKRIEQIVVIFIAAGLAIPSFLNWIRVERVNSYTRQVKEYFRMVKYNVWQTNGFYHFSITFATRNIRS